jgi:phage shock protein PspC (stress-responsive transcriptional regulator)
MNRRIYRPDDALLAGVCAEAARRLGWNVWALRAVLLLGLFLAPVPVGIGYLAAALVMGLLLADSSSGVEVKGRRDPEEEPLSEALGERGRRIAELERRFRDLERRES